MSDPILVVGVLADTIEVDPSRSLDVAVVVTPPVDQIQLETDVLIGQGPVGPIGPSPNVSVYAVSNAAIANGVLTLDANAASTFYVHMDQNVSSVVVTNWSATKAQRIHVYCHQDSTGNRAFANDAFPAGTRWSYGTQPQPSAANTIDSFVLEHLPTGNLVFGALVGQMYA